MKSIIQTRVDMELRKSAEHIFSAMGLSINDGIRIYLNQVVMDRAIPFRPSIGDEPNEMVKKRIANIEKGKNLIRCNSMEEFSKLLDSEIEE